MKKNLILFLTLFLGLKTLAATEPVVSLSDMKLKPGQQTTVSLELQNVDFAITSLQGDFILPTGVTVSDVTLVSDRIKEQVRKSEMIDSGPRQDHTPILLEIEI